ncbi:YaaL family protein [Radiobacillus sp. PE A8.2]|uniref:YaaL family protein n=1 Tax=Radiobacillus sp. PE A8.2 TaxID=3380349 RepID=UPI00388F8389
MRASRKVRKNVMDEQLLQDIFQLKKESKNLKSIIERSVDPSESGLHELLIAEVKYYYLLREARFRNISAL